MSTWFFAASVAAMIAVVILLAWRVWRLESRLEAFDRSLMRKGDVDWLQGALNENLSRCVAGSEQRVSSLARALGYEWKRTDAKEGWEKKHPGFGFGCGDMHAYRRAQDEAASIPIWTHRHGLIADRRKADRRKPTPQAAPKSPPKKRRAH